MRTTTKRKPAKKAAKASKPKRVKKLKKLYQIETRTEWVDHHTELMRRKETAHYEARYEKALESLQTAVNELSVCIAHERQAKTRNEKLRKFLNINLTDVRIAVEKVSNRPKLVAVLGGVLRSVKTIK